MTELRALISDDQSPPPPRRAAFGQYLAPESDRDQGRRTGKAGIGHGDIRVFLEVPVVTRSRREREKERGRGKEKQNAAIREVRS
jgi:hypothetical protein